MNTRNAFQEINRGDKEAVEVFSGGLNNAVLGLSQMAGQDITISSLDFKKVAVKDIPNLFGGAEAEVIAVYLEISGKTNGHMVIVYEPKIAFDLIDLLLGQEQGTTKELAEMEISTLGEVGNIMGSFFLNHVLDNTGLCFQPSPPAVMMDMVGAILDAALAILLEHTEEIYIMEMVFGTSDRQVAGTFLVIPDPGLENS